MSDQMPGWIVNMMFGFVLWLGWFMLAGRKSQDLRNNKPEILNILNVKFPLDHTIDLVIEYALALGLKTDFVDESGYVVFRKGDGINVAWLMPMYLTPITGGTKIEVGIINKVTGLGFLGLKEELDVFTNGLKHKLKTPRPTAVAAKMEQPDSLADEINKLAMLKGKGLITEDEFLIAKKKILSKVA